MNEKNPEEIRYRRLAFKFFDKGKSPAQILAVIPRSRSWLFKWKKRYDQDGWAALDSLSKAPAHSPDQYPSGVVKLVVRVRQRLEQATSSLINAREIQHELWRRRLMKSPPSQSTIKRWLRQAGLIGSPSDHDQEAYYPVPHLGDDLVSFGCDWTARYLTGGQKVFVYHTIDHRSHALAQTLRHQKTTEASCQHLLAACAQLGIPDFWQIDNDAGFTGLGRTARIFGRFVRLALYLGTELIFIPPGQAKRNHVVERVHGIWARSFWNKNHFRSLRDLQRKTPQFFAWYENYDPPELGGLTVKQAAKQLDCAKLSHRQLAQIPAALPLTAGRLHFIRQVDAQGVINILKEPWKVSKSLIGQYVWATLETGRKELSIAYRRSERAQPKLVKQYVYEIDEPVHKLKPEFQRRRRKIEILKIL